LKYEYLEKFDRAMVAMIKQYGVLLSDETHQLNMDENNKVIIFNRGGLTFIFNFHPTRSIFDYKFQPQESGSYKIILCSDDKDFGGFDRVDTQITYDTFEDNGRAVLSLYVTNRTAMVLE